jgi:hypothetical protein
VTVTTDGTVVPVAVVKDLVVEAVVEVVGFWVVAVDSGVGSAVCWVVSVGVEGNDCVGDGDGKD